MSFDILFRINNLILKMYGVLIILEIVKINFDILIKTNNLILKIYYVLLILEI